MLIYTNVNNFEGQNDQLRQLGKKGKLFTRVSTLPKSQRRHKPPPSDLRKIDKAVQEHQCLYPQEDCLISP